MIFYQVEDVHKRFSQLEELKSKNWEEVKPVIPGCPNVSKPAALKVKPKPLCKNSKKPVVSSKFKLFRQQMLEKKGLEKANDSVMIL